MLNVNYCVPNCFIHFEHIVLYDVLYSTFVVVVFFLFFYKFLFMTLEIKNKQ